MKTLKKKSLKVILMVSICFATGMLSNAVAQNTAAKETPKYQKEKSDITGDLAAIKLERQMGASLEKKYKSDKAAGRNVEATVDEKQLAKANADLQRDKLYLRADKRDLMRDHNLAIDSRKATLHSDRFNLSIFQTVLKTDMASNNESAVGTDALLVVKYKKAIKRDEANLQNERLEKNDDLVAVNEEIKIANGQFIPVLYAENTVARTENWMANK